MRHLPPPAHRQASPPTALALSHSAGSGPQIPALPMAVQTQAWLFAAALVFFHGSEYVLAAAFHGHRNVTATSLLISKQYVLAMGFAMLEHLTEGFLFPELKGYQFVSNIGLLMVLVGEVIRKIAVVTAGRAFTHVIRIHYEDQHQLITHGVYRFMRHPGYLGFLLWAVGTQLMLCNPISTVAFALVLWRFFSRRIPYPSKTTVFLFLHPTTGVLSLNDACRLPIYRMYPLIPLHIRRCRTVFLVIPSLKSRYGLATDMSK